MSARRALDKALGVAHPARVNAEEEGSYTCPACGEEILVLVDLQAGSDQEYVEDCPVCCRPVVLSVHIERDGVLSIGARPE